MICRLRNDPVQDAKQQLRVLRREADSFSFATAGTVIIFNGMPALGGLSANWTSFTLRLESLLLRLFGADSSVYKRVHVTLKKRLRLATENTFNNVHQSLVGSLDAALQLVDHLPSETGKTNAQGALSNRIFIVHGHDHAAKNELERYLTELGLDPIVLHRQPDEGRTLIEKFEAYSDVGYAFVLLTPDDVGGPASDPENKHFRARQNVIFEFGFFVGRLDRKNVCCLYTGNIELPSDLGGLVYKQFHKHVKETFYDIRKELEARGYKPK
jgi:predicted nucleotide-binding protein